MTDTVVSDSKVAEAVQGLRDLADFIEANPDLDWQSLYYSEVAVITLDVENVRAFARTPGTWEKDAYLSNYEIARMFGPVKLKVITPRDQVCEKVVTVETVELPDPDAPKVAVEREKVEWVCKPLLGGDA